MEENNINNIPETDTNENVNNTAENVNTTVDANNTTENVNNTNDANNTTATNPLSTTAPAQNSDPQPQKPTDNNYGTISLVLGIVGIIAGCCLSWIGLALSTIAIVFAILDKKNNNGVKSQNGKIGFILGCVGIGISAIFIIPFIISIVLDIFSAVFAVFDEMGIF